MNWGAITPALGTLLGAGLGAATAGPGGALAGAQAGGMIGGATGGVAGQFMPKDMPPPPMTQLPGAKPQMPPSMANQGPQGLSLQGLMPGQGGFLRRPFV